MSEPIAYLNGEFVAAAQLSVSVYDQGFLMGVTATERLRTFGGKLFRLPQHLERLVHSLQILGIDAGLSAADFGEIAERVAAHNHALLDHGDDLGLAIVVTPGLDAALAPSARNSATVCLHTNPLPFGQWCDKYERGQALIATNVRQVPSECWPPELKCRSRVHYWLADREAAGIETGARALLLDTAGRVSEASTANFVIYRSDEGLVSPPLGKILPGISLAVLAELAGTLKLPLVYRDLSPSDVATAGEAMLCGTSPCILPVTRFNGQPIADGKPGNVFRRLLDEWSRLVGLDIAAQALKFARR